VFYKFVPSDSSHDPSRPLLHVAPVQVASIKDGRGIEIILLKNITRLDITQGKPKFYLIKDFMYASLHPVS
jgi:hypothetical protein